MSGKYKWRHKLKEAFNGGVLGTASGLLFHAEGDGRLVARDAETGVPIWEYDALGYFSSSVISYQIDDTQYVATMVSGNRAINLGGTLLVFKLGGDAQMTVAERVEMVIPEQPSVEWDPDKYVQGEAIYNSQCANCHGGIGVPSEVVAAAPDLRSMNKNVHTEYLDVVLRGTRAEQGMLGFGDVITENDAEAVRYFLIREANALRQSQDVQKRLDGDSNG